MAILAQEGDKAAYKEFLNVLYSYIKSSLNRKFGLLVDVEDLTQECIIGVHKNMASFLPSRPIKPWLNAIIRYKVADYFRVLSKRKEVFLENLDIPVTNHQEESNSIDMIELLKAMPETYQRALQLTVIDGLSYKEVALKEQISEGALRKRISRAYKELREIIKNKADLV